MIEAENFITPWSKVSAREFDNWHSMCSYLGAFPPALANYFIQYFSEEGDLVYDPFSGRGTTLLEARILGRNSLATDLNPIALALSSAKNSNLKLETILERIAELKRKYDHALYQPEAFAQDENVHLIFHPGTLAQLCYLRRKLLRSESEVDKFLVGATLGILHGGERSDGSSGYASIAMPNTFSMSPEYVRRFVQTKNLNRVHRDVFSLLEEKTYRLYKKHSELKKEGIVLRADAKNLKNNPELKHYSGKVDLILTSPPYLGIVNYAKQNWIRSWFMNEDPEVVSKNLDDDLNLNEWIEFSRAFLVGLKPLLHKTGTAVFVIGDVAKSKTSIVSLAREFCLMVKESGLFNNVWCINDVIVDTDKTTRIWGDTKGGATATDRIVILSDVNPFQNNQSKQNIEVLDINLVEEMTKMYIGSQN